MLVAYQHHFHHHQLHQLEHRQDRENSRGKYIRINDNFNSGFITSKLKFGINERRSIPNRLYELFILKSGLEKKMNLIYILVSDNSPFWSLKASNRIFWRKWIKAIKRGTILQIL